MAVFGGWIFVCGYGVGVACLLYESGLMENLVF